MKVTSYHSNRVYYYYYMNLISKRKKNSFFDKASFTFPIAGNSYRRGWVSFSVGCNKMKPSTWNLPLTLQREESRLSKDTDLFSDDNSIQRLRYWMIFFGVIRHGMCAPFSNLPESKLIPICYLIWEDAVRSSIHRLNWDDVKS